MQTMLTVLTQNSRFRRDAGCIRSKWRQKGEFSPRAERLPGEVRRAAQVECGLPGRMKPKWSMFSKARCEANAVLV